VFAGPHRYPVRASAAITSSLPLRGLVRFPPPLIAGHAPSILPLIPLMLQLTVVIAAEQLTTAYKKRPRNPGDKNSDPHFLGRGRYTFVSAIFRCHLGAWPRCSGFVWDFLSRPGLSQPSPSWGWRATEFIAPPRPTARLIWRTPCSPPRPAGRPVGCGRAGFTPIAPAVLIVLFTAVLISYCQGMARLLDECVQSAQ